MAEGLALHNYSIVAETVNGVGLVVKAARGLHAKIRHAEIIRSRTKTVSLIEIYDHVWNSAQPLTVSRFMALLDQLNLNDSEPNRNTNSISTQGPIKLG